ncbi:hypothetical protein [Hyalangium versicolor]|uniref:hypothetical protein n=1 Tax=Hyalangium versicolor TaxID=2861190 RepID=UPI001CD01BE6|nr:hypothetical protein [Hyalangium versicolor]
MVTTVSFTEAIANISDELYAQAMARMADKRCQLLGVPGLHANVRTNMAFEVKLGPGGLANLAVKRYCSGFTLDCNAWIECPIPGTLVSGYVQSSDGGGTEFANVTPGQRLRFELKTNLWARTQLSLHLRTTPALPEGTVLKVCMDIRY